MKIPENEIRRITLRVLTAWKEKKLIELDRPEGQLLKFMEEAFVKNLQDEELFNKEVEIVLKKYEAQINAGMDRRKLFHMVKTQLAKERKIVL